MYLDSRKNNDRMKMFDITMEIWVNSNDFITLVSQFDMNPRMVYLKLRWIIKKGVSVYMRRSKQKQHRTNVGRRKQYQRNVRKSKLQNVEKTSELSFRCLTILKWTFRCVHCYFPYTSEWAVERTTEWVCACVKEQIINWKKRSNGEVANLCTSQIHLAVLLSTSFGFILLFFSLFGLFLSRVWPFHICA